MIFLALIGTHTHTLKKPQSWQSGKEEVFLYIQFSLSISQRAFLRAHWTDERSDDRDRVRYSTARKKRKKEKNKRVVVLPSPWLSAVCWCNTKRQQRRGSCEFRWNGSKYSHSCNLLSFTSSSSITLLASERVSSLCTYIQLKCTVEWTKCLHSRLSWTLQPLAPHQIEYIFILTAKIYNISNIVNFTFQYVSTVQSELRPTRWWKLIVCRWNYTVSNLIAELEAFFCCCSFFESPRGVSACEIVLGENACQCMIIRITWGVKVNVESQIEAVAEIQNASDERENWISLSASERRKKNMRFRFSLIAAACRCASSPRPANLRLSWKHSSVWADGKKANNCDGMNARVSKLFKQFSICCPFFCAKQQAAAKVRLPNEPIAEVWWLLVLWFSKHQSEWERETHNRQRNEVEKSQQLSQRKTTHFLRKLQFSSQFCSAKSARLLLFGVGRKKKRQNDHRLSIALVDRQRFFDAFLWREKRARSFTTQFNHEQHEARNKRLWCARRWKTASAAQGSVS